jgi:hypothetical protein
MGTMIEQLTSRADVATESRVGERKAMLARQLRELLPPEISIEPTADGVLLAGRGLDRRLVLDASLRWTIAGLLK